VLAAVQIGTLFYCHLLSKNVKVETYKTIILSVVLYGCEIRVWSLTLREEQRLKVTENRVPRRIFGPKRDEINLHFLPTKMDSACSMHGENRNAYKVLVGKSDRKRPLGRPKHVWEVNMRLDLGAMG
jgi:hypothetical protein